MNGIVNARLVNGKISFVKNVSLFNDRYLISRQPENFLKDSSMQKQLIMNKLAENRAKSIKRKRAEIRENIKKTSKKLESVQFEQRNQKCFAEVKFYLKVFHNLQYESAVKIQAAVRGWIVRKRLEKDFLLLERKRMNNRITSLKQTEEYCLLNIGAILKTAAIRLQRFIRRCYFIRKIKRLKFAYEIYLESLKEPLYKIIQQGIQWFITRSLVSHLAYEKYKSTRLEKIRRKLALITIKTILTKKKIKIKLIKNKIRRYKKLARYSNRVSLLSSPFDDKVLLKNASSKKHMSVIISPSDHFFEYKDQASKILIPEVEEIKIEDDIQQIAPKSPTSENLLTENPQELKIESIQILPEPAQTLPEPPQIVQKTVKKHKKRLSPITKPKDWNVIPLLYQRELESRPQTHHYMRTTVSITRMLEANPSRSPPKSLKPTKIRIHSAVNKSHSPPTLNYLQQTVCSRLKSHPKHNSIPDTDFILHSPNKNIFRPNHKAVRLLQSRRSEDFSLSTDLRPQTKSALSPNYRKRSL